MKKAWFLASVACLLLVSACQRKPIEEAVRGAFPPAEENLVVKTYCRSCHVHVEFNEREHVRKVSLRYAEKSPLRTATRCLQCHLVRPETLFKQEARSTVFPHGALVRDMQEIPKPKPSSAVRLKRAPGAEPAPKQQKIPEPPEKKKRRWYFLYLF